MNQIKTLNELKTLAQRECGVDCYITLNFGAKSSKHISYDVGGKKFFILNLIDDSEDELTEEQIMDKDYTLIGEAIKKGSLIAY